MSCFPRAMAVLAASVALLVGCAGPSAPGGSDAIPAFQVDASWPQPLPNKWLIGQVSGVAVGPNDNVWVLQRPRSLSEDEAGAAQNPPHGDCCLPAPPVLEFSPDGRLLRSWGGPGAGYDWPGNEHGLHVDGKGFVWVTGNGDNDGQILKFTPGGRLVLQIGKVGPQTGSADTTRLGRAAGVEVDMATNELYVADGYHNRRVIVFDADTGAYKRHWGAYGRAPDLALRPEARRSLPPSDAQLQQFGTPVHCVRVARDGLVYVCDRLNNRVQVFRRDGSFVQEFMIEPRTAANGSVWDIVLSRDPQQRYLHLADGRNNHVLTLERQTGALVNMLGRSGRYAGEFHWVHDLAIDSSGNLYAGEVDNAKRVQKFLRK
jgi:DNA-binding beta-propeller fold protein YncE